LRVYFGLLRGLTAFHRLLGFSDLDYFSTTHGGALEQKGQKYALFCLHNQASKSLFAGNQAVIKKAEPSTREGSAG